MVRSVSASALLGFVLLAFGLVRCGNGLQTLARNNCSLSSALQTVDDLVYAANRSSNAGRIRVAANGDLFVAGLGTASDNNTHWIVRKGTLEGTEWESIDDYTYPSGESAAANDILPVSVSTLYAAGYGTIAGVDHWIVRRSEDGGDSWTTVDDFVYSTGGDSRATGIAMDSSGALYTAGLGTSTTTRWIVRKSTDEGDSWITVDDFEFSANRDAAASGIAVDAAGDVFAVGRGSDGTKTHWLVRKLINAGSSWTIVQDLTFTGSDSGANDIVVAPNGFVYVTGFGGDVDNLYGVTQRTTTGGSLWETVDTYESPLETDTVFSSITTDFEGNAYVGGFESFDSSTGHGNWVVRKSQLGSTWSTLETFAYAGGQNSGVTGVGLDAKRNLYATGFGRDPLIDHWLVRKSICQ